MRELRIEMTFVHDGKANIGEVIKEFEGLYADVQGRLFMHSFDDCKCSFEVSDQALEEEANYKMRCPHCKGIIAGVLYSKEEI